MGDFLWGMHFWPMKHRGLYEDSYSHAYNVHMICIYCVISSYGSPIINQSGKNQRGKNPAALWLSLLEGKGGLVEQTLPSL